MASFRYIVDDVEACVPFYRDRLGFEVKMQADGFAALKHEDLSLFLNEPGKGSAGKAGGTPEPGGWSRFMLSVSDLDGHIAQLRSRGAQFRGDVASGPGGRQILVEDPAGNVVELFEAAGAR
jgi:catechol 2,3-dioxygenase-like lactoylglutathione lyase family enzyme